MVRERRERLKLFVKCQVMTSMLLLNRYNVQSGIWRTKDSRYIFLVIRKELPFLALQILQDVTDAA